MAVFSISCFANTSRTGKDLKIVLNQFNKSVLLVKPFNPLLGETFEYEDKKKQIRFIAEQVSHHPPIGASHCETPNFIYFQTQAVKTKFLGNSLDVTPTGVTNVILKKWDECYSWPNIKTVVNNLILGKMWIDHYGKTIITVRKNSTQEVLPISINLNYKKCGWFGRGWRDVDGKICVNNKKVFTISGKWNNEIYATADPSTSGDINYSKIKFDDNNPHLIWKHEFNKCSETIFQKYEWSNFTEQLIKLDDELLLGLPYSDSRLREDRLALEKGDIKSSSKCKNEFEDAQRSRKKTLDKSKCEYKPRYFDLSSAGSEKNYKFNGKYWTEKAERMKENIKLNKKMTILDSKNFWLLQSHESWISKF